MPLVRQAIELGADLVKVDPTDDPADFARVVTVAAGKPVLVRGGGKTSEEQILARTCALMATGASGIVYGRNVIQHPRPTAMTRAFMAIAEDLATKVAQSHFERAGGTRIPGAKGPTRLKIIR